MKKRYILMAVTAALVFAVAAGGTLAAQQAEGATAVVAQLAAPKLDIEWYSMMPRSEGDYVDLENIMPGGEYSLYENYNVYNRGDVPAYVRVTVTKYWADSVDGEFEKNTDLDSSNIELVPAENDGWMQADSLFAGRTKSETQVFYFTTPLKLGESTGKLLDQLTLDENLKNEYASKGIILKAEADGVQFVTGDNELNAAGILSAWGVTATLDADGNIVSIEN